MHGRAHRRTEASTFVGYTFESKRSNKLTTSTFVSLPRQCWIDIRPR